MLPRWLYVLLVPLTSGVIVDTSQQNNIEVVLSCKKKENNKILEDRNIQVTSKEEEKSQDLKKKSNIQHKWGKRSLWGILEKYARDVQSTTQDGFEQDNVNYSCNPTFGCHPWFNMPDSYIILGDTISSKIDVWEWNFPWRNYTKRFGLDPTKIIVNPYVSHFREEEMGLNEIEKQKDTSVNIEYIPIINIDELCYCGLSEQGREAYAKDECRGEYVIDNSLKEEECKSTLFEGLEDVCSEADDYSSTRLFELNCARYEKN